MLRLREGRRARMASDPMRARARPPAQAQRGLEAGLWGVCLLLRLLPVRALGGGSKVVDHYEVVNAAEL